MIKPTEMKKVSLTGPKKQLDAVVETLHDLNVLHIDDYSEAGDEIDIGSPRESAETLSDRLLQLRSLRNKLPAQDETTTPPEDRGVDDVAAEVDETMEELAAIEDRLEGRTELLEIVESVQRLGLGIEDITGYSSLDVFVGHVADDSFTESLPEGRYELYQDGGLIGLFVDRDVDAESILRDAGFDPVDTARLNRLDDVDAPVDEITAEIRELENEQERLESRLEDVATQWSDHLAEREKAVETELEKAEAPMSFAATDHAFFAEGWIPAERFEEISAALEDAADGHIYIEELELDPHTAPVEHDNPDPVSNFESLIGLYNTPSYNEIDPTFLLLTFPILFGFMLGDLGYGITTFIVFYAFSRKFPETAGMWKSLMFASITTMVFGLIYAEAFGFIIFGHESVLSSAFGLTFFESVPIVFHRGHELTMVMVISLLIGVVHVNLGFLVGAYNEYISHGLMEAVFAKLSWIVIEIGAAVAYLSSTYVGLGIMLAGVGMLAKGEGIEGVVEIPSLLSNILSYLRLFGVSIAILALAAVVNSLATPLFQSGSVFMVALGVVILIIGHTINTFLKMMEAGLQGIRLHYVEFFTKFFHGGGTYYKPFGSNNT